MLCVWVQLTSRDLMRYRTIRPLSAASVWLSKSGEFIPNKNNTTKLLKKTNTFCNTYVTLSFST